MRGAGCEEDIHLSVVAPVYNEAENLPPLLEQIAAALEPMPWRWEVVLANDDSDDDSPAVLRRLMEQYPQLRVLGLRKRSGQTAALDAALRAARGRFIATLDADLQNDPADIPRLLEMVESGRCDIVNGWRKDRKDPPLRLISTRGGNWLRNKLTRENLHDSGCGLKVFRRQCIERVKFFNGMHRFFATLVRMEGYRVEEVPVNHRPRTAGVAKYGFWNRIFKVIRDAIAVRWMQDRTVLYEADEWPRRAAEPTDSPPEEEAGRAGD
ncbi:MAG: glycosyltransferase family 2 protein [Planctomycetes bacterium]|nr:glycosyltransferase family 2 protein [Planctomycetota bacterium]